MKDDRINRKLYRKHVSIIVVLILAAVIAGLSYFLFRDKGEDRAEDKKVGQMADEDIDEGAEILRRFQSIDWEQIRPRICWEDPDWDTNVFYLATLPEDEITMYGYNDEEYQDRGVAIAMADTVYYFDWYYLAPRRILPQMYWNDIDQQLQVTLHIVTGSDIDAEVLHVLQMTEENELEDYWITPWEYGSLLSERIGFSYEKDTHRLTLYDNQDNRELAQVDLSWLEEKDVEKIVFGEMACFQLGNEIYLRFMPGFMAREWAIPQYHEMPKMKVQVLLERNDDQIVFSLGEIDLEEENE